MRPIQLLFDENVSGVLEQALRRCSPATRIFRVGHEPAPPIGTSDVELLRWAEKNRCLLIPHDHATFPDHFAAHLAAGRRCWGLAIVDPGASLGTCIEDLRISLGASSAEDWIDRIEYLPF